MTILDDRDDSVDIGMSFGIDKCKRLTIQRGKIVQMENIQLDNGEELKSVELNQQYISLGFGESLTTDKTAKAALKNEYFKRLSVAIKTIHIYLLHPERSVTNHKIDRRVRSRISGHAKQLRGVWVVMQAPSTRIWSIDQKKFNFRLGRS